MLLCIFAPRNPAEFARVLRPDGRVIVVTPAPEHLRELRQSYGLLGLEDEKHDRLLARLGEHLAHEQTLGRRLTTTLPAEVLTDLVRMGPNAHHTPRLPDAAQQVQLAVQLTVFRPR